MIILYSLNGGKLCALRGTSKLLRSATHLRLTAPFQHELLRPYFQRSNGIFLVLQQRNFGRGIKYCIYIVDYCNGFNNTFVLLRTSKFADRRTVKDPPITVFSLFLIGTILLAIFIDMNAPDDFIFSFKRLKERLIGKPMVDSKRVMNCLYLILQTICNLLAKIS